MKRFVIAAAFVIAFMGADLQACQAECKSTCNGIMSTVKSGLSNFGQTVDAIQLPIIGALGNILPIAVFTYCLKKFPGQSMMLAGFAVAYGLYQNEKVRAMYADYFQGPRISLKNQKEQKRSELLNDAFFVFDGDMDASEDDLEETEDELLDYSLLQDDEVISGEDKFKLSSSGKMASE